MRKVQSIKGEIVDFDLLEVKSKMADSPKSESVVQRERFIDKKRRRSNGRKIDEMLEQQSKNKHYAESIIESQRNSLKEKIAEKAEKAEKVEISDFNVSEPSENNSETVIKGRRLKG